MIFIQIQVVNIKQFYQEEQVQYIIILRLDWFIILGLVHQKLYGNIIQIIHPVIY